MMPARCKTAISLATVAALCIGSSCARSATKVTFMPCTQDVCAVASADASLLKVVGHAYTTTAEKRYGEWGHSTLRPPQLDGAMEDAARLCDVESDVLSVTVETMVPMKSFIVETRYIVIAWAHGVPSCGVRITNRAKITAADLVAALDALANNGGGMQLAALPGAFRVKAISE